MGEWTAVGPALVLLGGFPRNASRKQPANAGDIRVAGSIPGLGTSPEGRNGNPSSILAWRISWTEDPGGLLSIGSQRVGPDWSHMNIHIEIGTLCVESPVQLSQETGTGRWFWWYLLWRCTKLHAAMNRPDKNLESSLVRLWDSVVVGYSPQSWCYWLLVWQQECLTSVQCLLKGTLEMSVQIFNTFLDFRNATQVLQRFVCKTAYCSSIYCKSKLKSWLSINPSAGCCG